ncbi:MAG TPA: hypothetical protein DCL77_01270 [Prolixibacteraceae bacterium]|jgi:disulfide oxidoreductase YuzD|nr:hypothetical protein [Prolixibacteraceae bacterium]
MKNINWLLAPEDHDYSASFNYLSLTFPEVEAKQFMEQLKNTSIIQFKAKDLFRASSLPLLDESNKHVNTDLQKIKMEESLSPLLLVRNTPNQKLIIADGYHRLCAVYSLDEDALIPCKIV